MIKKIIAYIISHLLFYMGDVISRPMLTKYGFWLNPVYSKLMTASAFIQDWAGNLTPWKSLDDHDE